MDLNISPQSISGVLWSSMIYIAHRGNINGSSSEFENSPGYLEEAINRRYHVEVDVWLKKGEFWLGHDKPQYKVDSDFLDRPQVWCHAKNIEALASLLRINTNCFWHQNDDVVLTSRGYLWTSPGKYITKKSIAVLPETVNGWDISMCYGICSDYVEKLRGHRQT